MSYNFKVSLTPNIGYPDGTHGGNKPKYIIIHHWGAKGQSFDNVVKWLRNSRSNVSAHYVVQNKKVVKLAKYNDCTWHAGDKYYNTHSIGIECRPECTSGDVNTLVELIANIYLIHGVLPLIGHKDVVATACPGLYYSKLNNIEKRAVKLYKKKKAKKEKKEKTYSGTFPKLPKRGFFKYGDISSEVKLLQKFLNWAINANLKVDGEYGNVTECKVMAFQKLVKITADGEFGTKSLEKAKSLKK